MAMVKVRLTIRPDEEIEVPEDEAAVLRYQRLLIEDEPVSESAGKPKTAGKPADRAKGATEE